MKNRYDFDGYAAAASAGLILAFVLVLVISLFR